MLKRVGMLLVRISLKNVAILFLLDLLMIALHLLFASESDLFHLDRELNLPTFYQGVKLIVLGAVLMKALIARRLKFFIPLSFILICLGFDEILMLHENFEVWIHTILPHVWEAMEGLAAILGYNSSRWVMYLAPLIFAGAIYISILTFRVRRRFPSLLTFYLLGFALFAAAIIFEVYDSKPGWSPETHNFLIILEESSEMFGASFLGLFVMGICQNLLTPKSSSVSTR